MSEARTAKTKIAKTDRFWAREPECPVVVELKKRGYLKIRLGQWVEITCPTCGERGCYVLPSEKTPLAGVYACACGMSTASLLTTLQVSEFEADWRDKLILREGEFRYAILTIKKRLSESGTIFRFCGRLVEIVDGKGNVDICGFTKETLPLLVSRYLSLYRVDRRMSGELKLRPTDLPERIARTLASDDMDTEIASLRGVVECPLLLEDGQVKIDRGYDPGSRLWLDIEPKTFKGIAEKVSRDEAEKAYARLQKVLAGVSFAQESDEAAAIASMLCAVLKPSISTCPMVHVFATTPGAGKSSLTRALTMLPTRKGSATYLSFPTSEEEMQRLLASALRNLPKVVVFDNVTGGLVPYGVLCTCLTEGQFSARILGSSTLVDIRNESLFIGNGNHTLPLRDLMRRTLVIGLDTHPFRPVERSRSIEDIFSQQRTEIIRDALVIFRAWFFAGAVEYESFPSFPEWDRKCRFPLLWLGKPDPLQRTHDLLRKDDGSEEVSDLLALLRKRFKGKTFKVADIRCWVEKEAEDDALKKAKAIFERWELIEEGRLNTRKAGHRLLRVAELAQAGGDRLGIVQRRSPVSFRVTEAV